MFNIDIFNDDDNDLEILGLIHIQNRVNRKIYIRAAYFETYDDMDFFKRFRLTKDTTHELLVMIEHDIEFVNDK